MKLKLISLVTAFAMILSLLTVVAYADGATIEVGKVSGKYKEGQIVTVDISIKNNPGFVYLLLGVKFDTNVLELVDVKDNGKVSYDGSAAGFTKPAKTVNEASPVKTSPAKMCWDGTTLDGNCTANGTLVTLKFKVLSGATAGNTAIELAIDAANFFNHDEANVAFTVQNGTISIDGVCPHTDKRHESAVAATCKDDGNIEYYVCKSCGQYFDKDGNMITQAATVIKKNNNHSLVPVAAITSPTCGENDVDAHYRCTVCGKLFTDAAGKNPTTIDKLTHVKQHDLEKIERVEPDCTTPGKAEHYKCRVCNSLFADAAGTKKVENAKDLEIPAAHKLTKTMDYKAPTCTEAGNIAYWTCSACKKTFSDAKGITEVASDKIAIAALGHDVKKVEAKAPTCQVPGNDEYYECSRCHAFFKNAEATQAISDKSSVVRATVAHKAAANAGYASDATNHWQLCKWCGEKVGVTAHNFNNNGKCTTCGAFNKDGKVMDHKHTMDRNSKMMYDANKHWYPCSDPACAGHADEAAHNFTTTTETINGKKYEVKTCDCGYVTRVEVKNNTTGTTIGTNPNAKNPYEKNDTTKKDNGKKVESGKTFDAGIALYVGLSVLSVTGGALVIGKKKEF